MKLIKEPDVEAGMMEVTPLIFNDRLVLMECVRPGEGGAKADHYLQIKDVETGDILSRFGHGYGLGSAIIHDGGFYVFASRYENNDWNDVTVFYSKDLKNWESKLVVKQEPTEHLFNTSVCWADGRFVMAYETNDPQYIAFTILFAESKDLLNWTKIPNAISYKDRYTACPCLRYMDGYFYMLYLEHLTPDWRFDTYMTRSKDLVSWEDAPRNPILTAEGDEGVNASDPDLVEFKNKVYLYYAIGDQKTWTGLKRAVFDGTLTDFFHWCYTKPELHYAPPEVVWKGAVIEGPFKKDRPPLTSTQERFKDMKFGIFIHWGLYSILGHGEWALFRENIPIEEYDRQAQVFNPVEYNPDEWVKIAKESGARYMTFTTKHHDGYCLFDSRLTDHTSVKTAPHRDLVKELADACKAGDIDLMFYYSMPDWHFPNFEPKLPEYTRYMEGQVDELCSRYGKVAGFWFDMGSLLWRYNGQKAYETIRAKQPDAVIMSCDFIAVEHNMTNICDYDTQGRLVMSPMPDPEPDFWPIEVCDTMNDNWGYNPSDTNYKSSEDIIRHFVSVVGRGGNLLLNIGPTPSGSIPPEQVERLKTIGAFLSRNGEAIYETRPAALPKQSWGYAVTRDKNIYLHVLESQPQITVQGLKGNISSVSILGGKELKHSRSADVLLISIPSECIDPVDTVIKISIK